MEQAAWEDKEFLGEAGQGIEWVVVIVALIVAKGRYSVYVIIYLYLYSILYSLYSVFIADVSTINHTGGVLVFFVCYLLCGLNILL